MASNVPVHSIRENGWFWEGLKQGSDREEIIYM